MKTFATLPRHLLTFVVTYVAAGVAGASVAWASMVALVRWAWLACLSRCAPATAVYLEQGMNPFLTLGAGVFFVPLTVLFLLAFVLPVA